MARRRCVGGLPGSIQFCLSEVDSARTGHFVPSKGPWRQFFRAFLQNPLGGVPAPGEAGFGGAAGVGNNNTDSAPASTVTSGTATPLTAEAIAKEDALVAAGALAASAAPPPSPPAVRDGDSFAV
jgi:hypothetical protein